MIISLHLMRKQYYEDAKKLLSAKKYEEALEQFYAATELDINNVGYYIEFGKLLTKANQDLDAILVYEGAINDADLNIKDYQELAKSFI